MLAAPLAWTATFGLLWLLALPWPQSPGATVLGFAVAFSALCATVIYAADAAARLAPARRQVLAAVVLGGGLAYAATRVPVPAAAAALVGGGAVLTACAWLGAALGRGMQSPAHVWPLVVVALGADVWSVTAAEGFTQQVVVQDQGPPGLLQMIVLAVPVPGVGVEPVLGVGDVAFTGLLLGAVRALELPVRRALIGLGAGYALCLGALIVLALPIPALPFIGVAAAAALGSAIRPRPRELALAAGFIGLMFAARLVLL